MSFHSDTMREVSPRIGFGEEYSDVTLFRESPHGKLYVALKAGRRLVLKTPANGSGEAVEHLKREYEMSLSLNHPGLVYVFSYESSGPVGPCMVMEYAEGETLDRWLAGKPSLKERRLVFRQLLDVVGYIHSKNVIHNDLAPQNILVAKDGNRLKLIDFGFSDDSVHYLAKSTGGTREYASPELLGGRIVDSRSDIWSLGKLMGDIFGNRYSCIAGRCMRKLPDRRYATADEIRRAMKRADLLPLVTAFVAVAVLAAGYAVRTHSRMESLRTEISDFSVRVHEKDSVLESLKASEQRKDSLLDAISRAEHRKDSVLNSLKDRLNEWYSREVPVAVKKMEATSDWTERNLAWSDLADKYTRFSKELLDSCPDEYKADYVCWSSVKYSRDFPLPPPAPR